MTDLMNDRWNTKGKTKAARKASGKKTVREQQAEKKAAKEAAAQKVKDEAAAKLPAIAKEITVRLEKADKYQGQADDHRLAAALKAAEAKKQAEVAGVAFAKWAKSNIKEFSFETVRKLATVGAAKDPAKALQEMREKNKAANKRLRDKARDLPKPERGATKKEAVVDVALKALDRMPDVQRKKLIESVAKNEGLAVVTADQAKAATAEPVETVRDAIDQAKHYFNMLDMTQKKSFIDWAQGRVDELSNPDTDAGDVPEFLDRRPKRTRKTKPAAEATTETKAAPKKRTRKTKKAAA